MSDGMDGMDGMGLVIMGQMSSESTFGVNNQQTVLSLSTLQGDRHKSKEPFSKAAIM